GAKRARRIIKREKNRAKIATLSFLNLSHANCAGDRPSI
ncbi:MAG: hypothetical protein RLZZ575_1050, partial [Actinomycetota bacterium]